MKMSQGIERIADSLGYLVLNEDGAVISSGGELENDEKSADVVMNIVQDASQQSLMADASPFNRLSVVYDSVMFMITVSNDRVYVSKRKYIPQEPAVV